MIKIYDRPMVTDSKDEIYMYDITDIGYNFYEDDDNLYAEIFIQYKSDNYDETEGSYQVAIDKKLYSGQVLMVALGRPNLNTIYKDVGFAVKYKSMLGKAFHAKYFPKKFNVISIWIPSDYINDPILVMPHMRTKVAGNRVAGCDYEEVELIDEDPQTTLISQSEEATLKKEAWRLKGKCIKPMLDPCESIAYLEGQVDVLTKIIKMLVSKTGIDIGEYKDTLNSIEQASLINVKPLDMINADILKDKSVVREVQKKYYQVKYNG